MTTIMVEDQTEAWLIAVCRDLGLSVVDRDDDFFEIGGTSLSAVRLIARVEERFGEDALPPDDLFTNSRLADIAKRIENNSHKLQA